MSSTTPGQPAPLTEKAPKLYKVHFKRGQNPGCWALFYHTGELPAAINAARDWCHRNDYKFIHTEIALVNLGDTQSAD